MGKANKGLAAVLLILLALGLVLAGSQGYARSRRQEQAEERAVIDGLPKSSLPFMQAKDIASLLLRRGL